MIMAAGIVFHNITTAAGVTFSLACWVPDTALPDVGAIPVSISVSAAGAPVVPATAANQTTVIGHLDGVETLLTTIDGRVDGLEALLTTQAGFLDGLETAIALTNTKLDTSITALQLLDNAIAGNEMQVDILTSALPAGASTAANQATLIGHVDGVETLLTAIDGRVDGLETLLATQAGFLDGLEAAIASSNTKLDTIITNSTGATPPGTNNIGDVDVLTLPALVTGTATVGAIVPVPKATANGATSSRVNAAASTNATSLKGSAGNLINLDVFNVAAYDVFLKFYNKASAPTVGTDTPVWTIPIKAGTGYAKMFVLGKSFATGLAYAITKLQADSDTTVVVAGDLTGSIDWM